MSNQDTINYTQSTVDKTGDLKPFHIQDKNVESMNQPGFSDLKAGLYTGIGIVKEDMNKWESFKHCEKPMKDFWIMTDNLMQIYAITLALKFEIFEKLAEESGPVSVKDLLLKLSFKLPERRFVDWLDQLYVHGFLEREGVLESARYKISEYTRKYFLKSSHNSYVDVYLSNYCVLSKFQQLEKNLPSGKFESAYKEMMKDEENMRRCADFYYKTNIPNFDLLIKYVDFSKYETIVDLAGKTGCLGMRIAQSNPLINVISFDDPKWEKIQKDEIKKRSIHLPANLRFEYGSVMTDKIPVADCVIIPQKGQWASSEEKEKLAKKISDSMKPGARLIIMENVISEERNVDDCGLKQSFYMLMNDFDGVDVSFTEKKDALIKHGFTNIELIAKILGNTAIISAIK